MVWKIMAIGVEVVLLGFDAIAVAIFAYFFLKILLKILC